MLKAVFYIQSIFIEYKSPVWWVSKFSLFAWMKKSLILQNNICLLELRGLYMIIKVLSDLAT